MKTVIIVGSARKNGDTKKVASSLMEISGWDLIDLLDYHIEHFDYAHQNQNDDFMALIKQLVAGYDVFIFATPVYWYAMSGTMKVFFDRLTDLLTIEKDTGRLLRKKHMAVISSSSGDNLGDDFWLPFQKTAAYLGMTYLGNLHTIQGKLPDNALTAFQRLIEEQVVR